MKCSDCEELGRFHNSTRTSSWSQRSKTRIRRNPFSRKKRKRKRGRSWINVGHSCHIYAVISFLGTCFGSSNGYFALFVNQVEEITIENAVQSLSPWGTFWILFWEDSSFLCVSARLPYVPASSLLKTFSSDFLPLQQRDIERNNPKRSNKTTNNPPTAIHVILLDVLFFSSRPDCGNGDTICPWTLSPGLGASSGEGACDTGDGAGGEGRTVVLKGFPVLLQQRNKPLIHLVKEESKTRDTDEINELFFYLKVGMFSSLAGIGPENRLFSMFL